jgi:hypothetical protein
MAREILTEILFFVWLTSVSTVLFRLLPASQNGSPFKVPSLRKCFSLPPYYSSRVPMTLLSYPTPT